MNAGDRRLSRRPSAPADTEWARAVHHEAVRDVVERQFGKWDLTAQDRFFEIDWSGGEFEILECDGERCGYVCIEERESDVHVREIVVAPVYQDAGIGTSVLADAIERARRRGVPVLLGTLRENRAAVLYRRLGFTETGSTETHTLFRLDTDC